VGEPADAGNTNEQVSPDEAPARQASGVGPKALDRVFIRAVCGGISLRELIEADRYEHQHDRAEEIDSYILSFQIRRQQSGSSGAVDLALRCAAIQFCWLSQDAGDIFVVGPFRAGFMNAY
jgi:hypothetical protein